MVACDGATSGIAVNQMMSLIREACVVTDNDVSDCYEQTGDAGETGTPQDAVNDYFAKVAAALTKRLQERL